MLTQHFPESLLGMSSSRSHGVQNIRFNQDFGEVHFQDDEGIPVCLCRMFHCFHGLRSEDLQCRASD